jgi:hypothetical protein
LTEIFPGWASLTGEDLSPFGGGISCRADPAFAVPLFGDVLGGGTGDVDFSVIDLGGGVGNGLETLRWATFGGGVSGLDTLETCG